MRFYVGTSGFSYKEWKGPFYPGDLPDKNMLRFYGERLSSVEINSTFYRMPEEGVLKGWAEQVPPDFRFALKASRKITHTRPLKEKTDDVGYLFRRVETLGEKLGAILFQLPPYLRKDIGLLADFVELLPSGFRIAFEFRHRSWFDDEVYEILREKGYALCCTDSEKGDEPAPFIDTAHWGYFRLRKPDYPDAELMDRAEKVKSRNWEAVYAFFKHEDEGAAPTLAGHFMDILVRES